MTDPALQMLAHYDRWATTRLIDACRSLDDAALDRVFDIGAGSLRRTLVHIIANMECWLDRAHERHPPRFHADPRTSLDDIAQRFIHASAQLDELAREPSAGRVLCTFDEPGESVTVRLDPVAIMLHIVNHATHHRAQCLNMLRQLGHASVPDMDFIDSVEVELISESRTTPDRPPTP